jgi:hypothetical protein
MKSRIVRRLGIGAAIAFALSLGLVTIIGALPALVPFTPLYPPGPPYSRNGNGSASPNTWSDSGHGNPQYGQSGNIFWWQCPPQLTLIPG